VNGDLGNITSHEHMINKWKLTYISTQIGNSIYTFNTYKSFKMPKWQLRQFTGTLVRNHVRQDHFSDRRTRYDQMFAMDHNHSCHW